VNERRAMVKRKTPADTPDLALAPKQAANTGEQIESSKHADPFDGLSAQENRLCLALLAGDDWETAIRKGGWADERSLVWTLARPRVRVALERAALLADPKVAARILAPYALERLARIVATGGDAQAIHAARDVLAIAGLGPVSRSEHTRVDAAQIARLLAERDAAVDVTPRQAASPTPQSDDAAEQ
jgi:hypothetical protein